MEASQNATFGEDFENAAASVTEPAPVAEPLPEVQPAQELVDDEWAALVVQGCFWPLTFAHEAWKVTDEEAKLVAPEMRAYLNKTLPPILERFPLLKKVAGQNKELIALARGMIVLYLIKRVQVRDVKKEQERLEKTTIEVNPEKESAVSGYRFEVPPRKTEPA